MRLLPMLMKSFPLFALAVGTCSALAAEPVQPVSAAKKPFSAFTHPFNASLSQEVSADPRQGAALMRGLDHHRAEVVAQQMTSGFGAAPVPDENIEGPQDSAQPDAYVKPDFFSNKVGEINDAAAENHPDQHRKGGGAMAGGLALAVPLSQ
ncbi:hypothetical protein [Gluconobacter cerinus]|uniref:hypothetical protein n=1 Tax=Gluconobacter cerinus TaxID=38307 RepID=UPI001B8AF3E9|nr:hypothetical protein [Gluconobacter cerinus]MBS1034929.1 hypothetical protein [Gluconobacter cerinus]